MRFFVRTLCLALVICIGAIGSQLFFAKPAPADRVSPDATQQELTFAVVPQQSASRLAREWGPLIAALSDKTGYKIRFITTKDIPTFEACLDKGVFDIAYMNPYHYVVFSEKGQYSAIAHQADRKLRGLMVVRAESTISDISALDGLALAFPSPGAFGASVLPRAELLKREIAFEPRYVRSHDSVYRAVVSGFVAAGGGVTRTLNAAPEELRQQLRVIYQTDAYTPHAVATRVGLDREATEALRASLVTLAAKTPEILSLLGMSGFVAADDADWDDVRSLALKPEQAGLDRLDEVVCPFD